jgi:hypothetical protein
MVTELVTQLVTVPATVDEQGNGEWLCGHCPSSRLASAFRERLV